MENDHSYFMRRAAQERSAATKARNSKVRAVHKDLAERYNQLAHAMGARSAAPVD
jgi:hypothetical protein